MEDGGWRQAPRPARARLRGLWGRRAQEQSSPPPQRCRGAAGPQGGLSGDGQNNGAFEAQERPHSLREGREQRAVPHNGLARGAGGNQAWARPSLATQRGSKQGPGLAGVQQASPRSLLLGRPTAELLSTRGSGKTRDLAGWRSQVPLGRAEPHGMQSCPRCSLTGRLHPSRCTARAQQWGDPARPLPFWGSTQDPPAQPGPCCRLPLNLPAGRTLCQSVMAERTRSQPSLICWQACPLPPDAPQSLTSGPAAGPGALGRERAALGWHGGKRESDQARRAASDH